MQVPPEVIIKEYQGFANIAEKDGDHLYKAICDIIISTPNLIEFSDNVQLGQPTANIVLGGIHYLLLKGYQSDLGQYYPTVQGKENVRQVDDELKSLLLEFIEDNKSELEEICKTRRVQTNEIGRCSFVLPGLNYLQNKSGKPIIFLELGTSAGLLMLFDKFGIDYGGGKIGGNPYSELKIECEVKGDKFPPVNKIPNLKRRVGVDLLPISCTNSNESLWLQAFVWPKNLTRFNQLRKALEICKNNGTTVELVKDDGFENIVELVEQYLDKDAALCVYHSFAINQISKHNRDKFYEDLRMISKNNKITLHELTVKWGHGEEPRLVIQDFVNGEMTTTTLANIHHHGDWIEWIV